VRIAVIPARGGSKRLPGKNIRQFAGKPMIAHPIGATASSRLFDHILVSTDDDAIADVARKHGAVVPFVRPAYLADDRAHVGAVVAHAVRWMHEQGWAPDAVCLIYATAPFIDPADLQRGADAIASGSWDYVFAVTDFPAPIFRAFSAHPDGGVEMFFPDHYKTRSQDLPVALHDAGQFCFGVPQAWLDGRPVFGRRSCPIEIPRWRVQDIDTPDDWARAELIGRLLASGGME
jgi:N-acylneuraminate cytidylyltransferase